MIKIKIKYDPYNMKTALSINGLNVKKKGLGYEKIAEFVKKDIPLQSWIDPIEFQGWNGLLWETIGSSEETEIEVNFEGRKLDFIDLKEALENQSDKGEYNVSVSFPEKKQKFIFDDHTILERVKTAYNLINSEEFKKILDDKIFALGKNSMLYREYESLEQKYKDATDNEFSIVFSGMYSSGKSTIINAILGKNILPTSDGTCTSKIFRIQHDPAVKFAKMSCLDKTGKKVVVKEKEYTEETLQKAFEEMFPRGKNGELLPSNPPTIETVLISTNMYTLHPESASYNGDDMHLVIIDTPGTSSGEGNMGDDGVAHSEITKSVIQSDKKEIVIFTTNATEDKDDSIQDFLDMIDACGSQGAYDQRFMYVLNKADGCNFKENESWKTKLATIREYYIKTKDGKKRAIQNPRFFPTCALGTYEVRSGNIDKNDDDKQRYKSVEVKYYYFDEDEECIVANPKKKNYHFDEICSTSQTIKTEIIEQIESLKDSDLKPAHRRRKEIELHSGIVSLEMAIRDYIEKYAFPLKIQDLLKTYKVIFDETKQLVNVASVKFDEAVEALKSSEFQKESEAKEKKEQIKTKKSLEKLSSIIAQKNITLGEISENFNKAAETEISAVKIKMNLAIEDAKEIARQDSDDPKIRDIIIKTIDSAACECKTKIDEQLNESYNQAKILEKEIKDFFEQARGIIDFGNDFKIEHTAAFKMISLDSIKTVEDTGHWIKNPERKKGWWLGPVIWGIKNLFVDKKIYIKDGINIEELNNVLGNINTKFDKNVDSLFSEAKKNLAKAVEKLSDNLLMLEEEIITSADRIEEMKESIKALGKNIREQKSTKEKLDNYKNILALIRDNTDFIDIDDMEEE